MANYKTYSMELGGRTLSVDIGRVGKQANGCCFMHYGDTLVLSTATASKEPREGIDFFPLSVEFEEKMYAVGKFPGGFNKREGKASTHSVLTSRVIDRPMRPLFPKDYRNDVTLNNMVMSVDPECDPEIPAMLGSALATSISDIPFDGPCATTQLGMIDGEFVVNPGYEQKAKSDLALTVASTREKVIMIEAGANEIPEAKMIEAIYKCDEVNKEIIKFFDTIIAECGKEKSEYQHYEIPQELNDALKEICPPEEMEKAVFTDDKQTREKNIAAIKDQFTEKYADKEDWLPLVGDALYQYQKKTVRKMILQDHKRPDGRQITEIRPLAAEIDLIPRAHGSAMFTRGQTQICDCVTLAPLSEAQKIEGLDPYITKARYMHQYNFPSYSVGETKPSRGPGRREIGHGALAERALIPVLPSEEEFPYAIRAVSETFESNGSTSQASICASSMALMAAGVPIKKPVAGISCGLVTGDTDDNYIVLTDIQGLEDFFGDMDFKVAGTHDGITAIQMDIKIHGLTRPIVEEAIAKTKQAREYILTNIMEPCIPAPRKEVSKWAPKIVQIKIDPEKIGDVVGQRGKTINTLIDMYKVQIDIDDDGSVSVCGEDPENMKKALEAIQIITTDFEKGMILTGKVVSIKEFGAFLEFAPGKESMVHISKIANTRINKVEDVLKVGDVVRAICLGKDKMGRISFSIKDCPKGDGSEIGKVVATADPEDLEPVDANEDENGNEQDS
ncbi:MAG: polyribonucleotide nucleotidyltransferase [Lachnospiraceae bacterium]|jgi:polyribonucleotide nucleotidyltransferase|nr:polyribonucleotide nucleotidyltransferase [Lachnospiraceae bacterium]